MSKSFYIKLIFAAYKVTELFPARQTLKEEIRKIADEILVALLTSQHQNLAQNIQEMNRLFDLAEGRKWIDSRNFLVLRREYAKIARFIDDRGVNSAKPVENSSDNNKNKKRQEVILSILKNNGKVKISDLTKSFPNLNRRTLLRDLGSFCQIGLIERNGSGRGVCYTIRNATL